MKKIENGQFGVNIWWTCPEVIRDAAVVQNALTKHGFKNTDIPLPSRRTEISRACYSFQNRQGKENRRVTEKANDDVNFVVYGILDREQEHKDEVGFKQHTTIRLDKSTDEVKVEGVLANEVMGAINAYSQKITDEDIRAFLRKVIRMGFGIAKRPTGGIYFVPEQFADVVRSAQLVLDEMKTGAKLYIEGVVNGERERANVWASVEEEIESKIAETLSAVERIERRTSAVKDQEEKLKGAKGLMDVYIGLLGEEAKYQDIASKIEEAVKKVGEKLAVIQMGTASVISKPKVDNTVKFEEPSAKKVVTSSPSKVVKEFSNDGVKYCYLVLKEAGKAMNYHDITEKALDKGLILKVQKASDAVYNRIKNSITKGEGLFVKVGVGTFKAA